MLGDLDLEVVAESWTPQAREIEGLTPICRVLCYDTCSAVVWSCTWTGTLAIFVAHPQATKQAERLWRGHSRSQFDPDTIRALLCSAASALRTQLSGTTLALLISGFRSSNWSGNATCELHSFSCKVSDAAGHRPATIVDNADRIHSMEGKSARCDNLRCVRHTRVVLHHLFTASVQMTHETFHISPQCTVCTLHHRMSYSCVATIEVDAGKIVNPHAMVY